jgi:hypothetical protein
MKPLHSFMDILYISVVYTSIKIRYSYKIKDN